MPAPDHLLTNAIIRYLYCLPDCVDILDQVIDFIMQSDNRLTCIAFLS